MYILDTDHLSILERSGEQAETLRRKLARCQSEQVFATIISYEEQVRGWLQLISRTNTADQQVHAYMKLRQNLLKYNSIPVLEFNQQAADKFSELRRQYPRIGTMDLKIAAIALMRQFTVLTRNNRDFGSIQGLSVANWT